MTDSCEISMQVIEEKRNFNSRKSSLISTKTSDSGCELNWQEQMSRDQAVTDSSRKVGDVLTISTIDTRKVSDEISFIFSLLHALIMTLLTIVFTISNLTHDQVTDEVSLIYFAILLLVGTIWYAYFFIFTNHFCKKDQSKVNRSPEPSNRWLKGVLGLFGIAVIMSDCLELATSIIKLHQEDCAEFMLLIKPLLKVCFVTLQLGFLFHHAKLHIPKSRHTARFGLAHVLATNISLWVRTIAEETEGALLYEESKQNEERIMRNVFVKQSNTTNVSEASQCSCNTTFCSTSSEFQHFLFPFQIEFCLISSCLIYILWRNVGRPTLFTEHVHKPCYSFLKSYKGIFVGAFSFVGTVIAMVVLATNKTSEENNFNSQLVFDGLLMIFNVLILISCAACFYLKFRQKAKYSKLGINLDVVLLFVCLIGPFTLDLFSIVALSFGNKDQSQFGWEITICLSLVDILVNIAQVLLTAYGLSFLPQSTKPNDITTSSFSSGVWNAAYQQEEKSPFERFQGSLPTYSSTCLTSTKPDFNDNVLEEETASTASDECKESLDVHVVETSPPKQVTADGKSKELPELASASDNISTSLKTKVDIEAYENTDDKFNKYRIWFRDFIIFLVMVNVSLWMFFSFNGTVYKVDRLESQFYGINTWLVFKSVAAPIGIYLKMHLAACLFEVWTLS